MATFRLKGKGILNDVDNKRGEKGIPMLPELSPDESLDPQCFRKDKSMNKL